MTDGLIKEFRKVHGREDLETAAGRYLDDGGRPKTVGKVAVSRLHENRRFGEALGVNVAVAVPKVQPLPDVPPRVYNGRVSVYVRQPAQRESVEVVAGIRETVDDYRVRVSDEFVAETRVELVVSYRRPVYRFLVAYRRRVEVAAGVHGRAAGLRTIVGRRQWRRDFRREIWRVIIVRMRSDRLAWTRRRARGRNRRRWIMIIRRTADIEARRRIRNVVRHSSLGHLSLEVRGRGQFWREFRVSRHQNRWQAWTVDPLVVIRIDANFVVLRRERVLARLDRSELVVRLKIGPAPDSTVNHVRQTLPVGNLQPAVQTPRYRHALARRARTAQRSLQFLDRTFAFLQFFHQRVDRLFRPLFLLVALLPPEELLRRWTSRREQGLPRR